MIVVKTSRLYTAVIATFWGLKIRPTMKPKQNALKKVATWLAFVIKMKTTLFAVSDLGTDNFFDYSHFYRLSNLYTKMWKWRLSWVE